MSGRRHLPQTIAHIVAGLSLLVALTGAGLVLAAPLGTAFTYQGQLRQGGTAINGTCDVAFSLFDDPAAGAQIGATQTANGMTLVDGRFTVQLDFGPAAFDGQARWLQVAVRCPSGSGGFTNLDPRQPLTPSPYSLFAQSAASALTATNFSGSLAGDVTGAQGSTVVARLQGRNVVNTAPVQDDVLRYNATATQWEPGPEINARNYLFVYDTSAQNFPPGIFVVVSFTTTAQNDGWIVAASAFQAGQSGLYLIHYEAHPSTVGFPMTTFSFRVRASGNEIPGSQASTTLPTNSSGHLSKSFLAQLTAGDVLNVQAQPDPGGGALAPDGAGTTPISASLTVTRIK